MTAKASAGGGTGKHAGTSKHAGTRKHTETAKQKAARHMASVKAAATRKANKAKVTAKGKPAVHAKASKPAGFAVGDLLPVCALEAVAMSLRLAGQPVPDDEVAWLWELCGSPEEGVSVGEALAAAALSGLGGQKPRWLPVLHPRIACGPVVADAEWGVYPAEEARRGIQPHAELQTHRLSEDAHVMLADLPCSLGVLRRVPLDEFAGLGQRALGVHPLILHVDVPGPHAVLATPDGWWSWGELHTPWTRHVSEAWAVSWS